MKAFKTYELCPIDQKPDANIPDAWPWQIQDIDEASASEYLALGFQVLNQSDFTNYLSTHQDNYNQWSEAYEAQKQTTEAYKKFTISERKQFADELMQELKLMNIEAGVNLSQSLWLHHRLRNLTFTVGSMHAESFPPLAPLVNQTITIDFLNLVVSGDVETAYAVLLCITPDDMSQPFHALNNDFTGYIRMRIAQFLGWL